jgi:hypothetical protein
VQRLGKALAAGGLYVLATERHEPPIDNPSWPFRRQRPWPLKFYLRCRMT